MSLKNLCAAIAVSLVIQSVGLSQGSVEDQIAKFKIQLEEKRDSFRNEARAAFASAEKGKKVEKVMKAYDDHYSSFFDLVFAFFYKERTTPGVPAASAEWAFNIKAYQRDVVAALIEDETEGVLDKIFNLPKYDDVRKVQKNLPENSCLIEYILYKYDDPTGAANNRQRGRYIGWLIPSEKKGADSTITLFEVGDETVIKDLVGKTYAKVSVQGSDEDELNADLTATRKALFRDDVWKEMQAREKWVISPTADLWLVPFSALPLPANSATLKSGTFTRKNDIKDYYAIEKHSISYLISGREILQANKPKKRAPKENWSALIVGNPEYNQIPKSKLGRILRQEDDYSIVAETEHFEFTCFRPHRFRRAPYYFECPPPFFPPVLQTKGHLVS